MSNTEASIDIASSAYDSIAAEVESLRAAHRFRTVREWPHLGGTFRHDGRMWSNFSSNDYLDLARHPRLREATTRAISDLGTGATASRLMAGSVPLHRELEDRLAKRVEQETALAFPTGYQTNLGVITALANRDTVVFSDALNHASLIDGARLSRATVAVYRHGDMAHLDHLLRQHAGARRRVVVSDALFSMDGDCAPVRELRELADRYDAFLIIDEAHALGVYGRGGGVCLEEGVRPDVTVGTMSKALGASGGFAATCPLLRNLLINRARSFIYTTAIAPPVAAAACEAVAILREQPGLGATLLERASAFRAELARLGVRMHAESESQIVPIPVASDEAALQIATALEQEGILATAIRPPTVPQGQSRIRLSITLAHTPGVLRESARRIATVLAAVESA